MLGIMVDCVDRHRERRLSFSGSSDHDALKNDDVVQRRLAGVVSGCRRRLLPKCGRCARREQHGRDDAGAGKIPPTPRPRAETERAPLEAYELGRACGPEPSPQVPARSLSHICASPPRPLEIIDPMLGRRFVRAAGNGSFSALTHARVRPITKGLRGPTRHNGTAAKGRLRIDRGTIPVDERRRVAVD